MKKEIGKCETANAELDLTLAENTNNLEQIQMANEEKSRAFEAQCAQLEKLRHSCAQTNTSIAELKDSIHQKISAQKTMEAKIKQFGRDQKEKRESRVEFTDFVKRKIKKLIQDLKPSEALLNTKHGERDAVRKNFSAERCKMDAIEKTMYVERSKKILNQTEIQTQVISNFEMCIRMNKKIY